MIINGKSLLDANPIENMVINKTKFAGASYGLGEAGYDITLKQNIQFFGSHDDCYKVDDRPVRKGRFVIASASELFHMPNNLVGIVHDKSTWARKGLSVFNTVIEPGWRGYLTLELVYHGSDYLELPAGVGIAQVIFHETKEPAAYNGKYQDQENKPIQAIYEHE